MSAFSIPLTNWQVLHFSGAKAQAFLQGQFTLDLSLLAPNQIKLGAYCNPQGRVLALFYLYKDALDYFAILPASLASNTQTILRPYAALSKIQMKLRDDIHIWGFDWVTYQKIMAMPAQSNTLASDALTQALGVTLSLPHSVEEDQRLLFLSTQPIHFPIINQEAQWHLLNLDQGIPCLTQETSGLFLPQELQLLEKGCVSLKKGCYVGQEVIARLHYRSQFKRLLCKIQSSHSMHAGADLFSQGKTMGKIIDVVQIDEKNSVGLASLRSENLTLAAPIFSDVDNMCPVNLVSQ